MRAGVIGLSLFLATTTTSASAKDTDACAKGMVCASDPKSVVQALQDEGFKAKLETGSDGDPKISSSASGYNFTVHFYGCEKGAQCDSLQFYLGFKSEDDNTPAYANAWNVKKRFITMSAEDDKSLNMRYDVTTAGGLTKRNFADVVDWWTVMLDDFDTFVAEQKKKS
jgi:Putative bacterial sensory transduction regulator